MGVVGPYPEPEASGKCRAGPRDPGGTFEGPPRCGCLPTGSVFSAWAQRASPQSGFTAHLDTPFPGRESISSSPSFPGGRLPGFPWQLAGRGPEKKLYLRRTNSYLKRAYGPLLERC